MIRLKQGQTLAQYVGENSDPLIHNFVNKKELIKPELQEKKAHILFIKK